jgi:predicted lipoprotein with Yx(FWY)xxD motif
VLYRLDLDRYRKRRPQSAKLIAERCGGACGQLWTPAAAPAGLKPDDDFAAVERKGAPAQLSYKGDPLYTFAGKSLDEAAKVEVAPSYFSSYAAKPVQLHDGVPSATLYWHEALYQPPQLKTPAPAGVSARWVKTTYVFADSEEHKLYAPKVGRGCVGGCDGLAPLAAPMAALPVGDWRPVEGKDGQRLWSYKGRLVYRAEAADTEPGADWQALEAR